MNDITDDAMSVARHEHRHATQASAQADFLLGVAEDTRRAGWLHLALESLAEAEAALVLCRLFLDLAREEAGDE